MTSAGLELPRRRAEARSTRGVSPKIAADGVSLAYWSALSACGCLATDLVTRVGDAPDSGGVLHRTGTAFSADGFQTGGLGSRNAGAS